MSASKKKKKNKTAEELELHSEEAAVSEKENAVETFSTADDDKQADAVAAAETAAPENADNSASDPVGEHPASEPLSVNNDPAPDKGEEDAGNETEFEEKNGETGKAPEAEQSQNNEAVAQESKSQETDESQTAAEPDETSENAEEDKIQEPSEPEKPIAPDTKPEGMKLAEPEKKQKPETETERRVIKSSVQYSKSAEREKNIKRQVKKRKRRPVLLVLFLCSMLVLVAIIYNSITREPEPVQQPGQETLPTIETPPPAEIIVPTPPPSTEPSEPFNPEGAGEENQEPDPEPVVEHSYQFFVEDISWEAARQRCEEMGGYLAVISSSDELEQIIAMAENYGVTHVWLGCHRVDGELVWERDAQYYYQWDSGEPSAYDYNDNVAEDYLMFWEHNGRWYYNDSRNDPCGDYPAFYSGDMGYVCEFGTN